MGEPARPLSLLVTALPGPARGGELVGHAQVVATGDVVAVHSLTELGVLLRRLSAELGPEAAGEARPLTTDARGSE